MWMCEFCKEKKNLNQKDFVNHLRSNHLLKYSRQQNMFFQCNYGENGKCINKDSLISEFLSEKEYEQHLLKLHLVKSKVNEHNICSISDYEFMENSRNYHMIVNPPMNTITKWNPYHSVVNLPAVLNDPHNRQMDVFSKTWGESFEKSEIPQCLHLVAPSKELFSSYVKQVRCSLKYREAMLKRIHENKILEGSLAETNHKLKLDNVPKIFFQVDFNLNSKEIFSSVIPIFQNLFPSSSPLSSSSPGSTLLDNQLYTTGSRQNNQKCLTEMAANRMSDKLSHYLDIVEINIAKQVSKKANSFFEAINTHDKVQEKLKSALGQISVARAKLLKADEMLTKNHIHVLMLSQRRTNLQILLKQLRVVKTVHSTQAIIQTLLSSNDFCGALDVIAGTQSIMQYELLSSKESAQSPILCLRHVHAQLVEMRKFVERMVQQEYINAITYQLRLDNDSHSPNGELHFDYQLVPSLLAMIRIVLYAPSLNSNINEFVQLYFDEAMEVLKTIVKSRVLQAFSKFCQLSEPEAMTNSMDEKTPGSLADQMRALNFDQWLELMSSISNDMLLLLDKFRTGSETMIDTVLTHVDKTGIVLDNQHVILPVPNEVTITEQLRTTTISEIQALPLKIVETIVQRITKLMRARAKNRYLERLLPTQMVQLNKFLQDLSSEIHLRIGLETETSNILIASCLHEYANRLATRFHNEHKEKLILILDSDLWRAAEVPSQLQELAKHISSQPGLSLLDKNGINSVSESQISHQWLHLDHNRYTVVAAALMLFQMIVEYCQCAIDLQQIPSIAELLFGYLISLLETFNSRSCQLVLGAKARQLVELETISARNLALTARSLQLVLALTPRISAQFSNIAVIKVSLLTQLADMEQLYRDHIERINLKLISLMDERIKSRISTWTGKPPTPSNETRAICQHLSKLHEAVCDVYQTSGETELFLKIHNIFKSHLRSRMRDMNIVMDNGPQHGIVKLELAFYMSQLTGFCGLKKFTDKFSDIWM